MKHPFASSAIFKPWSGPGSPGCLWAVLVLVLCSPACCVFGAMKAGAATENVTPRIGIVMNGGTAPAISTHIHDELHARALVFEESSNRFALVVVDSCLIDQPVFDEAKKRIQIATGIPRDHVIISCTHTHSGGSVTGAHLSEPDPEYREWLPGRLADAVHRAVNNLAPAQVAFGSRSVPQHVFCRRIKIKPGAGYTNQMGEANVLAKMNWDSPHPADGEPCGPVDPGLSVLSVRHMDGRPLALLANYSLHYVGDVAPGHISADYYGVFCERMTELLQAGHQDPPFVAIMSNGTSGDVNNVDYRAQRKKQPPYTQIRRVAEDVAIEAARVCESLRYTDSPAIKSQFRELSLNIRKPSQRELDAARELLHGRPASELRTWPEIYAREQTILAGMPDEVSLPLQVIRIGGFAITALPFEAFASTGLELKQRSPIKPLFNISLANGWYAYVPPPEQHKLGAYETWRGRTSLLEVDATTKIIHALLEMLDQLQ